jgi:hypothetical protein
MMAVAAISGTSRQATVVFKVHTYRAGCNSLPPPYMPFIYIDRERWQKLKQLCPSPTRRSIYERTLWAIDHVLLLTLDEIDMSK